MVKNLFNRPKFRPPLFIYRTYSHVITFEEADVTVN